MEWVIIQHKIYTKKYAINHVKEIIDGWERKGYNRLNDVPPTDKDISEFLSIMKGFGYPVDYKYQKKLKKVL
jgi:hypothetical protein